MELELHLSPIDEMRKAKNLTDGPFGVNVQVANEEIDAPYLVDAIIEERKIQIVRFSRGLEEN